MSKHMRTFNWAVVRQLGVVCTIFAALALPAAAQDADDQAQVKVSDFGTVELTVQDTDLAQVLQMLSIQSKKNIVTSKSVSATVTANLYNATFYEALEGILRANGYRYIEEGNFIYVYTQTEYDEIIAATRKRESRIFTLEYLSALDASEAITPLLSADGASSHRGEVTPGIKPDISDVGADSYAFDARLVVNDYPENLEAIAALLEDMDTAPQQVLVEATILQTQLTEDNAFGIDFSAIGSLDFTDLTNPLSAVNNLLGGNDAQTGFQPADNRGGGIASTPGNTSGPGTFKLGIVHDDFSVFLKLLDEVTDTTVLARPKVLALNRQRAEVLVGARVGYLSTTATETTTTQTVEFLDTGIHLLFRPFISRNGMIRLELAPSVSEAQLREVTDANAQQITIPDEVTSQLTTNVRVRDGETIILGGLFTEKITSSRSQVPFFGDMPLIGAAFRGHDDTLERDEIIFLITPSIIHDERLFEAGTNALGYTDEVLVGARDGLLPFSRDKQTDTYNRSAIDAFASGDVEKALYHVNNSLRLRPQQPEMIKFRQRLTGEQSRAHERALLERALNHELREDFETSFKDNLINPDFVAKAFVMPPPSFEIATAGDSFDNEQVASVDADDQHVMVDDADASNDQWWAQPVTGNEPWTNEDFEQFASPIVHEGICAVLRDPYGINNEQNISFLQSLSFQEFQQYEEFLGHFYRSIGLDGFEKQHRDLWSYIHASTPADEYRFTSAEDFVDFAQAEDDFPN